jgi:pilus assembly protein CpaF
MTDAWVSPLVEIERAVQHRAKEVDLDITSLDGLDKLRLLIDDAIERWDEEHRRGRRPSAIVEPRRLAERALRNLAGYGPVGGHRP